MLSKHKQRLFAVCRRAAVRGKNEPPAIHLSKHLCGPTSITYNLKRLKKTLPTDTIKGALLLLRVCFLLSSESTEKDSVFLSPSCSGWHATTHHTENILQCCLFYFSARFSLLLSCAGSSHLTCGPLFLVTVEMAHGSIDS